MKKVFYLMALMTIVSLASCSNQGGNTPPGNTQESSVDATESDTWHYFSFAENKEVGTGLENDTDNAAWAARTDWDIAICKYKLRTNSGAASDGSGKGGVYTCASSVTFENLDGVPEGVVFETDKAITSSGMSGTTTEVRSEATVILFKTDGAGDKIMPPVYLKAPVYVFRTADGKNYFKVQFTQYVDSSSVSGKVKFYSAQIY